MAGGRCSSLTGALAFVKNDAREFLVTLLEVNSTRVQSDILNRIQESHQYLEVEIRKLLHEVSRVAEQALRNARRVQQEGASAVEAAQERIAALERQVAEIGDASRAGWSLRGADASRPWAGGE